MHDTAVVEQRFVEARCAVVHKAMHDISAALSLIQSASTAMTAATGSSGLHVFQPLSAFFKNPLYREGESFAELEAELHKRMLAYVCRVYIVSDEAWDHDADTVKAVERLLNQFRPAATPTDPASQEG